MNAELITALRYCAEHEGCDYYIAKDCPRESTWMCGVDCGQILMLDAADALEAAEKRIAELEAQLPNEGEWIESEDLESVLKGKVVCSICGEPEFALIITNEFVRMKNSKSRYCPNCGARMDGERKDGAE